jgi:2-C-methyl-D-erythritol 4-phosphate cytidylyltransferase
VAAGSGARFGARKQYESLGGRRVLDWSVAAARSVADGIVLVVPPDRVDAPEKDVDVVVAGAATRAGSVRAGLAVVPADARVIVVHDAARPLATAALFTAVVAALADTDVDGAVPGVAVADTIKRVQAGRVMATLDRTELVAVQTPQAFRATALRAAHASRGEATDDAALVEASGGRVVVVEGEAANAKVTTAADLASVRRFLGA